MAYWIRYIRNRFLVGCTNSLGRESIMTLSIRKSFASMFREVRIWSCRCRRVLIVLLIRVAKSRAMLGTTRPLMAGVIILGVKS